MLYYYLNYMYNFKKINPKFLYQISNMELRARLVVEGFISGLHKSPYLGFNIDFAEHREYTPGDEIKYIDWKIYAKRDKFYVKRFEEETNMRVWIVLDKSKSMAYCLNNISKFDYARFLAASLSYLMLKQNDAVGLACFSESIDEYLPPAIGKLHIRHILSTLDKITTSSSTNIASSLCSLAERAKKRGLIIIISDFLDDEDKILKALSYFKHKKHEVIAFHVLDDSEINLPYSGGIKFMDLESNNFLSTDSDLIKSSYNKKIKEYLSRFKFKLLQNHIDYTLLNTKEPFDKALFSYLERRRNV